MIFADPPSPSPVVVAPAQPMPASINLAEDYDSAPNEAWLQIVGR